MKLQICLKTPDCVADAIDRKLGYLREEWEDDGLREDEIEDKLYDAKAEMERVCGQFFEYGEQLVLEIDTEKETCKVVG